MPVIIDANKRNADFSERFAVQLLEQRYWPRGADAIVRLPLPVSVAADHVALPPRLTSIELPSWATDLGVHGALLVPSESLITGETEAWERTDWLGAAEWFITCVAERAYERQHGSIHSYSFRLKGWDARLWCHAWANRIALFLRRWAARLMQQEEDDIFGPLPDTEIVVTHDVDAVTKSLSLRVKQTAFHGFNSVRRLTRGDVAGAARKASEAVRFFVRRGNLWSFEMITTLEERHGIRSHFNFYGGSTSLFRSPRQLLIDPAYDIRDECLRHELRRLRDGGWTIGLHQSFDAWRDPAMMLRERRAVESAAQTRVGVCRQHWLRFSFEDTWPAQHHAGFTLDSTLGFNDRPAFRNGAALRWRPLPDSPLESLPMVAMDSHFYDYAEMTPDERRAEMAHWIGEVRAVHGQATVLWHQQVMGDDYGWGDGFADLLEIVCDQRAV